MMNLRPKIKRIAADLKIFGSRHPRLVKVGAALAVMLAIYVGSKSVETVTRVVHITREGEFKGTRIFGGTEAAVYEAKERNLSKVAAELTSGQKKIVDDVLKVAARLEALEGKAAQGSSTAAMGEQQPSGPEGTSSQASDVSAQQYLPSSFASEIIRGRSTPIGSGNPSGGSYGGGQPSGFAPSVQRVAARGPDVISFPVTSEEPKEELGIVLPLGSYVKAKIIAGAKATTGEPAPVLLQLDYSYVGPNQKKIDLSGCFMTAKAQADLSIERVKMQLKDMSCVSKGGFVFEKGVSGFVNDDLDSNFGISGPLESNQGRVARTAFMASVVEGVGKALQQAQTTQQATPLGGNQSVMTGDQGKYLAGGAAANAGSMVAQWYLKQAESLLPTITAGSGRDVWVVMLASVNLPEEYFTKGASDGRYSYVTRLLD